MPVHGPRTIDSPQEFWSLTTSSDLCVSSAPLVGAHPTAFVSVASATSRSFSLPLDEMLMLPVHLFLRIFRKTGITAGATNTSKAAKDHCSLFTLLLLLLKEIGVKEGVSSVSKGFYSRVCSTSRPGELVIDRALVSWEGGWLHSYIHQRNESSIEFIRS